MVGLPNTIVQAVVPHPNMTLNWNKIMFVLGFDNVVRAHRVEFVVGEN